MAVNSSSTNDSLPHPSTFIPDPSIEMHCFIPRPNFITLTTYFIINVFLLLPFCIVILHHGHQQLRSSSATMSHSDCFTYHMVVMELIGLIVYILYLCAVVKDDLNLFIVGSYLRSLNWHGQTLFHLLMCVERYLAVVHPITYRSLRSQRGMRFRSISVGGVWLLSLMLMGLRYVENVLVIIDMFLVKLSIVIVSFCSYSVLRVLNHPGPQEQGRERVDQFKRRAFNTIVTILAVMLLRLAWGLVRSFLILHSEIAVCPMKMFALWINLPSSLVLPLLFVYREGKVICSKNDTAAD